MQPPNRPPFHVPPAPSSHGFLSSHDAGIRESTRGGVGPGRFAATTSKRTRAHAGRLFQAGAGQGDSRRSARSFSEPWSMGRLRRPRTHADPTGRGAHAVAGAHGTKSCDPTETDLRWLFG